MTTGSLDQLEKIALIAALVAAIWASLSYIAAAKQNQPAA